MEQQFHALAVVEQLFNDFKDFLSVFEVGSEAINVNNYVNEWYISRWIWTSGFFKSIRSIKQILALNNFIKFSKYFILVHALIFLTVFI